MIQEEKKRRYTLSIVTPCSSQRSHFLDLRKRRARRETVGKAYRGGKGRPRFYECLILSMGVYLEIDSNEVSCLKEGSHSEKKSLICLIDTLL